MRIHLVRNTALLLMVATSTISAAALNDSLQRGKSYYFTGEFKKAISQFESMAKANPAGAEPYLWLGKSYAVQADIKGPILGARSSESSYLSGEGSAARTGLWRVPARVVRFPSQFRSLLVCITGSESSA